MSLKANNNWVPIFGGPYCIRNPYEIDVIRSLSPMSPTSLAWAPSYWNVRGYNGNCLPSSLDNKYG